MLWALRALPNYSVGNTNMFELCTFGKIKLFCLVWKIPLPSPLSTLSQDFLLFIRQKEVFSLPSLPSGSAFVYPSLAILLSAVWVSKWDFLGQTLIPSQTSKCIFKQSLGNESRFVLGSIFHFLFSQYFSAKWCVDSVI